MRTKSEKKMNRKKAQKAGDLAVALNGVIVRPSDEVDVAKEYQLIAYNAE